MPLLLDSPPLVIPRAVVVALAGNHTLAVVAQQVHYRATGSRHRADGHEWAVATVATWADDCVMHPDKIKRAFSALSDLSVLVTRRMAGFDRTAWRRIDVDVLAALHDRNSPDRLGQKCPDGQGDSAPIPSGQNCPDHPLLELQEPRSEELPPLTAGQEADRVQKAYWRWVKERTGRHPIGLGAGSRGVLAFKGLITPFLEAGVPVADLKRTLAEMYDAGATLTRQNIERHLDRRTRGTGPGRRDPVAALSAVQVDAHGNIV